MLQGQDNYPTLNSVSIKMSLAKQAIRIVEHQPYSPDLVPCDFFLFPVVKSALKGIRFVSADAMKAEATEVMRGLSGNDLKHSFGRSEIHIERYKGRGWGYIKDDNIKIVKN
ncbi:hypothetical protein AVEN_29984-1 [Araneus ventricosus]|uniref:Histone-lysine N-methyltransferase SETMAR n=1 Tax=Araneus ventricosus TaxID=182803 RepID=A0A4Y2VET9_ARAVE|nr:hypothetical protein AVEN_29984-1 [Araneus ventricosus]